MANTSFYVRRVEELEPGDIEIPVRGVTLSCQTLNVALDSIVEYSVEYSVSYLSSVLLNWVSIVLAIVPATRLHLDGVRPQVRH